MDRFDRAVTKRFAGLLVPVVFAASAGYVAWRIAAHRLHLYGAPSVWIGLFVFAAGVLFLRAWWRGGPPAAIKSLGWIAGAAVLIGLGLMVARNWEILARNPGMDAAWMIAITGLLGASARVVGRLRR